MIEYIDIEGVVCSIIVRSDYSIKGIKFFTQESDTMQIGQMGRPKGYIITPHIHKPVTRTVELTKEVLLIKKGKVKVDFYDDNCAHYTSRILYAGDVVLLATSGHGFEMLEDSEILEIKQGPYAGDHDKFRFERNE